MPDDRTTDDMVHESALQLWSAAQTDFDPFEVPPEEWGPDVVPVRDADIALDTHLELAVVRESIGRLEGSRLVAEREGTDVVVTRIVPDDVPL